MAGLPANRKTWSLGENKHGPEFVRRSLGEGRCRYCGCRHFRVIYTLRGRGRNLIRQRECRHCGKRITTWDRPVGAWKLRAQSGGQLLRTRFRIPSQPTRLEGVRDLRTIQELLGRNDVKTTMVYTDVLKRCPAGVGNEQ